MRGFAWGCVVAGVVLAVAAFFLTANAPTINPWPSLLAGLCLTALGIVLLAIRRNLKP
jgi:fucose permease